MKCAGIAHGKFRHTAYAVPRGERIVVVSQGPDLVEVLHPKTGASLERWTTFRRR